ncbi:MAG: hypothetical protein GXY85_05500, partial [Candidatus Brocadiaceae bacterium]|nr:hypothetical protein [Candidatus Brocadiaceae bacterium]
MARRAFVCLLALFLGLSAVVALAAAQTFDDASVGDQFIPIVLEIGWGVELDKAKVRLQYSDSDPAGVTYGGTPPVYALPAGSGDLPSGRRTPGRRAMHARSRPEATTCRRARTTRRTWDSGSRGPGKS